MKIRSLIWKKRVRESERIDASYILDMEEKERGRALI